MNGITRYLVRQLFVTTLFITFAITGVVWLSQSLRFIDLIINRGLSVITFLELTLLLLPTFLAVIMPLALFCAVMYTYHRLIVDSELVVLRAAGLSQFALARPALILASGVAAVCYGITLYLMPMGFREFKDRQSSIRSDYSHLLLQEGAFNTLSDGFTVYVRAREPSGELLGILVHDSRDPSATVTWMAERGALVRGPDGPRLLLFNGNRQEFDRNRRKARLLYFDRNSLDMSRLVAKQGPRWREPRERFLNELFGPPRDGSDVQFRANLLAEGHQRLVAPLYCFVFTLIGLAALLAGRFNRRGRLPRMIIASGAAVVFQGLALTLVQLIIELPSLTPVLYANIGVAAAAAAYVLLREGMGRPRPGVFGLKTGVP